MFTYFNYPASTAALADLIEHSALTCTECSTVSKKCEAMNNCNGNGQCDQSNGVCKCSSMAFKGADCSYVNIDLSREPHKIAVTQGDKFIYFTMPNIPAAWSMTLKSSSRDFTLYLKSGQD